METLPLYSAHVNGSSTTSTMVGTIGQTTEERLAGEDHAEIRYFTRYAVPTFASFALANGGVVMIIMVSQPWTEILGAGY